MKWRHQRKYKRIYVVLPSDGPIIPNSREDRDLISAIITSLEAGGILRRDGLGLAADIVSDEPLRVIIRTSTRISRPTRDGPLE